MLRRVLGPLAATALAVVSPVHALAATRIAVLTFAPLSGDLPNGAGDKAADLLATELKSVSQLEVVPRPRKVEGLARDRLKAAKAQLAAARDALTKRHPKDAQTAYETALIGFRQALPALDDFQDLIDCTAELGALEFRRGNDDAGRAHLLEAMRLASGKPLAIVAQAPSFAPVADALAKSVATLPKGSIRVDSTPEGAEVYVDGQDAGKAPVLIRDLPAGPQYLRAVLPSGELWGAVADVAPSDVPQHLRAQSGAEGPAAEINAQLAENRIDPGAATAASQAAKASEAALVVFGALHRTPDGLALDAFLYDTGKKQISRLARVAFDNEMLDAGLQMDKLVSEIQTRLGTPGSELRLPARVAEDRVAEGTLASEYRFGGAGANDLSDAPPPQPEGNTRRVVVHGSSGP
ncbi:MAG TPA: PEGA domain-containing protein [Myxococcales bacterium]|nr:PEGA domain-containing protein [Myxococcales bacterium]